MKKNLQDLSDESLLQELAQGTEKALDILYLRHSGRILTYARRRGLSPERADDLLQIIFLQIYRKKHLYNSQFQALAWVYVIARSELKDYKKREMKEFLPLTETLSQPEDTTPNRDNREESEALLQNLKPREQQVIKLRYLDELEYSEIAQRLNESEASVRQIVSRGLKSLRHWIKKKQETL